MFEDDRLTKSAIFVVDPTRVLCQAVLSVAPRIGVRVEQYGSIAGFEDRWAGPKPGCVVLNLSPDALCQSGLTLQAKLAKSHEYLSVVAAGTIAVETAFDCSKQGAFGFVKDVHSDEFALCLIQALHESQARWMQWQRKVDYRERLNSLTKREREVYGLLIEGFNNKEMAGRLEIAVGTIEKHKSSVLQKVRAKNPAHLLSQAFAAMGTLRIDTPSIMRPTVIPKRRVMND